MIFLDLHLYSKGVSSFFYSYNFSFACFQHCLAFCPVTWWWNPHWMYMNSWLLQYFYWTGCLVENVYLKGLGIVLQDLLALDKWRVKPYYISLSVSSVIMFVYLIILKIIIFIPTVLQYCSMFYFWCMKCNLSLTIFGNFFIICCRWFEFLLTHSSALLGQTQPFF